MSSQFFETREKYIFANHILWTKKLKDTMIHDFLLIFCENKQIDLCGKGLRNSYISYRLKVFVFLGKEKRKEYLIINKR